MKKKKCKELKKIAVAFALMNPTIDVKKEYKKLKTIHRETKSQK